jgi:hypothetical protein
VTDDDHLAEPMWAAGPAVAATCAREFSDMEIVRIWGAVLRKAALPVGVPYESYGYDFGGLAAAILRASRGGKLPADDYRFVWQVARLLSSA